MNIETNNIQSNDIIIDFSTINVTNFSQNCIQNNIWNINLHMP